MLELFLVTNKTWSLDKEVTRFGTTVPVQRPEPKPVLTYLATHSVSSERMDKNCCLSKNGSSM